MSEMQEVRVDVQEIMEQIRKEIKAKGLRDELPSFDQIPVPLQMPGSVVTGTLAENIARMNEQCRIQADYPLSGTGVKLALKKVGHKMTRGTAIPMSERITFFNECTVRTVNELVRIIDEQQKQIEILQQRLDQMDARLEYGKD